MLSRLLYQQEKKQYDALVSHPIQTWVWGDFQKSQGHRIYRFGVFDKKKLVSVYSVSFHTIPKTKFSVGTCLQGPNINSAMLSAVSQVAKKENAIFVKFEPDVVHQTYDTSSSPHLVNPLPQFKNLFPSPKSAFYPYSYVIDLTKTEEELLSAMHPKTRYNIKVANRHAVKISQDNSQSSFDTYLDLIFDTTVRQGFYLHSRSYHQTQWQMLEKTSIPHLISASYQGQTLSAFMLFTHHHRLFYPYGGSLFVNRQVMAPTLLMWEAIKYGKKLGCHSFDMWGSLGPDAKEDDPSFGFHRFKQGFGGQLVQFVGSYDFVLQPNLYRLYQLVDRYRWHLLRLKAKLIK